MKALAISANVDTGDVKATQFESADAVRLAWALLESIEADFPGYQSVVLFDKDAADAVVARRLEALAQGETGEASV